MENLVQDKINITVDLNAVIKANNFRIKELESGLSETEMNDELSNRKVFKI